MRESISVPVSSRGVEGRISTPVKAIVPSTRRLREVVRGKEGGNQIGTTSAFIGQIKAAHTISGN